MARYTNSVTPTAQAIDIARDVTFIADTINTRTRRILDGTFTGSSTAHDLRMLAKELAQFADSIAEDYAEQVA